MQFGLAGTGSTGHVGCAMLDAAIGVNVTHFPIAAAGRRCRI